MYLLFVYLISQHMIRSLRCVCILQAIGNKQGYHFEFEKILFLVIKKKTDTSGDLYGYQLAIAIMPKLVFVHMLVV